MICDQPVSGGVEIVEHILFFLEHSGVVPSVAEFTSTAKIRHGIYAALLHPCDGGAAIGRFQIHVESAISGEIRGIVAVELQSFKMRDEHWNLCAVFRYVPDLLHREFVWIDRYIAARPNGLFRWLRHSDRSWVA